MKFVSPTAKFAWMDHNKVKTLNQLKTESVLDKFQNKNQLDSACWQNVKR
jgi:hypothetical protein